MSALHSSGTYELRRELYDRFWALILGITTCCCCVPFCFDCFKDVQHRCSSCGALIATYMRSNGSTTTYY